MKITIVGAGAVGGHIAAHLARAGLTVSVIARGAHLAAIRTNGLRLIGPGEDFTVRIAASDRAEDLGPQDIVISTVKAHGLPDAVPLLKHLAGPDTPVIFAANGVPWWYFHRHPNPDWAERRIGRLDPDGRLWDGLGVQHAIGCVIQSPNTVIEPGVVKSDWARSSFVLGEPDGSLSPRLTGLVEALRPGLPGVAATADIRTAVWSKIVINLAGSAIGVLTLSTAGEIVADPDLLALYKQLLAEGGAVAGGLGVVAAPELSERLKSMASSTHKASMLQDLEAGRPLEIEAQLGAVQELARLTGTVTPTLDALLPLLRARSRH